MDARSRNDQEARARARRGWPVQKLHLADAPGDDLSATTTAEQRLAMMWPLALEAWSLTGRPMPAYERRDAPVKRLPRSASS